MGASMPELPEVETVVRMLRPDLTGKELRGHAIFDPRPGRLRSESFQGWGIAEIFRSGKQIVIRLSRKNRERFLAIHLRMSGRLLWIEGNGRASSPRPDELLDRLRLVHDVSLKPQHVRFCLHAESGTLAFADPRRFGTAVIEHE